MKKVKECHTLHTRVEELEGELHCEKLNADGNADEIHVLKGIVEKERIISSDVLRVLEKAKGIQLVQNFIDEMKKYTEIILPAEIDDAQDFVTELKEALAKLEPCTCKPDVAGIAGMCRPCLEKLDKPTCKSCVGGYVPAHPDAPSITSGEVKPCPDCICPKCDGKPASLILDCPDCQGGEGC